MSTIIYFVLYTTSPESLKPQVLSINRHWQTLCLAAGSLLLQIPALVRLYYLHTYNTPRSSLQTTNHVPPPLCFPSCRQSFDRVLVPPFTKTTFKPLAAVRYTSVIRERGVVSARGYAVKSRYTIA